MALAHLGDRQIDRLDDAAQADDGLVRYCAEFYGQARQEALGTQPWSFAKHAVALTQRSDIMAIGYSYVHELPEDKIRVLRLVPGAQLTLADGTLAPATYQNAGIDRFKIVGSKIWSDHSLVALEYIRDVSNPDDWTPHFRAAVARLLASYLAGPITDDPNTVNAQKRIYETVDLPNAQFYDAVQDNSAENSDLRDRMLRSPSLKSRSTYTYGKTDATDFS